MKKILFVIGTRPEIIKTAPVILEARRRRRFRVKVCFTGQHQSMVDQMLRDFRIPVDFDLKVMKKNQTLTGLAARTITRLQGVLEDVEPEMVLVQGDTTTAAMAALAAFYNRIAVGHIEAGLRTGDRFRPYPEEANRCLISTLADLHFAPTPEAKSHLLAEGKDPGSVFVTGNTVIDALQYVWNLNRAFINPRLRRIEADRKVILITIHRRESFGIPLRNICRAMADIARRHPEALLVYPVHMNPNVKKPVLEELSDIANVWLVDPLHYRDLVKLMQRSHFILTDSGGIQEEAPSCNKPVLVLREKTERPEGVKLGVAKLVGADRKRIISTAELLLESHDFYSKMQLGRKKNPYGDGAASKRIMDKITRYFFRDISRSKGGSNR